MTVHHALSQSYLSNKKMLEGRSISAAINRSKFENCRILKWSHLFLLCLTKIAALNCWICQQWQTIDTHVLSNFSERLYASDKSLSVLHLCCQRLRCLHHFGPSARHSDKCVTAESVDGGNTMTPNTICTRADRQKQRLRVWRDDDRRNKPGDESREKGQGLRHELQNQQMSITLLLTGRQKERLNFWKLTRAKPLG